MKDSKNYMLQYNKIFSANSYNYHFKRTILVIIAVVAVLFLKVASAQKQSGRDISETKLVNTFYQRNNSKTLWYGTSQSRALRSGLISLLESCDRLGMQKDFTTIDLLQSNLEADSILPQQQLIKKEHIYTVAAFTFLKELWAGQRIDKLIGYDPLSKKQEIHDNEIVLQSLLSIKDSNSLYVAVNKLVPINKDYEVLSTALYEALLHVRANKKVLVTAINIHRWINHFRFKNFIVINVASGRLKYFEKDSLMLEMKIVAGRSETPTPRFTAYCNQVILYPYWNVPRSIAINEILPLCKKAPAVLDFLNMQVIDNKGNTIDPTQIKWDSYNKNNFPYRFRQSTGCDNALGVIKFNITSPYGVYLHDTNTKFGFLAEQRYFSHGCIRIEKPVELANHLLEEKLNRNFLEACLKEQKPIVMDLRTPIPVFVIYSTAEVEIDGQIKYYPDVYNIL